MGNKYNPSINDFIFLSTFSEFPSVSDALKNKLYIDETNNTIYRSNGTNWINMSTSSGINYLGTWDSLNNTPIITSSVGTAGDFYKVSVASSGVTTIDGESVWEIDDQVLFNGTVWEKVKATNVDNTPILLSVDTTITQLNTIYLVDTTVSDITITIPDAVADNGGKYVQIIKDQGGNKVIVKTTSNQIIGTLTQQDILQSSKGFTATSSGASNYWVINQDSRYYTTEAALLELTAESITTITNSEQYYDIVGIFTDNSLSENFTVSSAGVITYTGIGGKFKIDGTSNSSVSKATDLTYGLEKNGVVIGITPHGFTNLSKDENFSITSLIQIENGDSFKIQAKASDTGIDLTVSTLHFVFSRV